MSKNWFNCPKAQWSNATAHILPYAIILKLQVVILHVMINAGDEVRKASKCGLQKQNSVSRAV